jgi:hypothetical protein
MEIQGIKVGTIIEGPKWPEPVEIKKVDYRGDYVHINYYSIEPSVESYLISAQKQ